MGVHGLDLKTKGSGCMS